MFMICYGNVHDGFIFTGPFLDHESALMYCEDNSENDDDQWNIVEINPPNEASNSLFDLFNEIADVLNDASNCLSKIDNANEQVKTLGHYAKLCRNFGEDTDESID